MIETPPLLAKSAALRLYLMLRRTVQPARITELLTEHLQWMIGQERVGTVMMSGPVSSSDEGSQIHGLTVLRAPDLAAACAIARTDPFIESGAVVFDLCEWTVFEGALSIVLNLSDSSVSFA